MNRWRPHPTIRVKVLGLVARGDALLAAEVTTDDGVVKGVRPLGGTVEFGETRETALRREYQEELSTDIQIAGDWMALENIYSHEGETGHEYIFAAPIVLGDQSLYRAERMTVFDAIAVSVGWFSRHELEQRGWALYPAGLAARLAGQW